MSFVVLFFFSFRQCRYIGNAIGRIFFPRELVYVLIFPLFQVRNFISTSYGVIGEGMIMAPTVPVSILYFGWLI
jgi:hypothetical protein